MLKNGKALSFITRKIAQINDTDIVLSGSRILVIENPWEVIDNSRQPKINFKSSLKLEAARVQSFLQDSRNQLWFGTDNGLFQCKYIDGKIEVYKTL